MSTLTSSSYCTSRSYSFPRVLVFSGSLLPIALLSASATAGQAMVTIKVNGAEAVVTPVDALVSESGPMLFVGGANDPNGLWSANWTYSTDLNPESNATVTGNMTFQNLSSGTADVELIVDFPICPTIQGNAGMAGLVSMTLVMDANGGKMTVEPGDAVYRIYADDAMGVQQYYGPFEMSGTGAGTATTYANFGLGNPINTPGINDFLTLRHKYDITSGDKATIVTNLTVSANPANLVPCQGQSTGGGDEGGGNTGGGNAGGGDEGGNDPNGETGTPTGRQGTAVIAKKTGSPGTKGTVNPPSSRRLVIEPGSRNNKAGGNGATTGRPTNGGATGGKTNGGNAGGKP